jgi:hypothetical protein
MGTGRRSLILLLSCSALACLALATAGTASALKSFQTPSHNIACVMLSTEVRCDIAKRSWTPPPKPKSCPLDYGNGLTVGLRGRAAFTCAGDTVLGMGEVLPYGAVKRKLPFVCRSLESGVHCVNRRNGHGFFLSRQVARRF